MDPWPLLCFLDPTEMPAIQRLHGRGQNCVGIVTLWPSAMGLAVHYSTSLSLCLFVIQEGQSPARWDCWVI